MTKVFFDASVLFSAIYSEKGGSAKIISLVKAGYLIGITTQNILTELKENITKFKHHDSKSIGRFILDNNILVSEMVSSAEIEAYGNIIENKDAHVLAGAIVTGCDYLVTLDKKHINNQGVKSKIMKVKILSPKDLLIILAE